MRVLYVGNSGDGLFPEFLSPAINVTYDYGDTSLSNFQGDLSQFNVIVGASTTAPGLATFIKNGGGIVEGSFGVRSNSQDNFLA